MGLSSHCTSARRFGTAQHPSAASLHPKPFILAQADRDLVHKKGTRRHGPLSVCRPGFAALLKWKWNPMKYDLELELTDDDLFELKSALELSRYLAQQYGNDDRRERCQELQKKLDASERKFRKDGHNCK